MVVQLDYLRFWYLDFCLDLHPCCQNITRHLHFQKSFKLWENECFHWVLSSTFYLVVCEMPLVCCRLSWARRAQLCSFIFKVVQICTVVAQVKAANVVQISTGLGRAGIIGAAYAAINGNRWAAVSSQQGVPLTGKHLRSKSNFSKIFKQIQSVLIAFLFTPKGGWKFSLVFTLAGHSFG